MSPPEKVMFPPPQPIFAPGDSVQGYEVVRLVGRGTASQVYEVLSPQGARLALKVQTFSTEAHREAQRFVREARSLRELHHPNIVRCEAIELDDEQRLCLLLEYLAGHTLRHVLHVRHLGLLEALAIGTQIAAALAAVHRRGLLHRDIKPENVFLLGGTQVKVIDFGLAKVVGTSGGTTRPVGTPLYMSPESLSGRDPSPAHDVYALGHVLYEMFRGRHAFARDDGTIPSHAEIMVRHVRSDPPIPPLAQVLAHFPERLSACVAKAMAHDPHQRHLDGHTLEHELHTIHRDLQGHQEEGFRDRLSDLDLDWSLVPRPVKGAFEDALDHTKPSPSDMTLTSTASADDFEPVDSTLPIFGDTSIQKMKARTERMPAHPEASGGAAGVAIVPPPPRSQNRQPALGWSHVGMLLVGLGAGVAIFAVTWWMGWW